MKSPFNAISGDLESFLRLRLPTPPTTKESDPGKLSTVNIVLMIAVPVALIIIFAIIFMIWQNHRRMKQSRLRKVELEKLISGSGDSCEVHNLDLKDLTTSGMFVFIHASSNFLKSEILNDALRDLAPNRAKHHNLKSERQRCHRGYHHDGFMATCVLEILEIHKVLFRTTRNLSWLNWRMYIIVFMILCMAPIFLSKIVVFFLSWLIANFISRSHN